MAKKRRENLEEEEDEEILGGGSTLSRGETTEESGDRQEGLQRDFEPDDYDDGPVTDASDDRVRGAGQQSLDELTITRGQGRGLAEHVGGIRHDRPEPNVNDPEPLESNEESIDEAV
jgi:hypothetical protein